MPLARTYLYVPGDRPERFAKAAVSGADAVVLDLEDGVGPSGKDAALRAVRAHGRDPGPQWWVRLDVAAVADGVAAAVRPGTTGIVLPGAERGLLDRLDSLLTEAERRVGLDIGSIGVLGLVETARGLQEIDDVARGPRVVRLGLGEADLAAALGLLPGPDREELWPARFALVVASAAAGLAPPVGPVETRLGREDPLRESTHRLLRQGYAARTLLHPDQVGPVHEVLRPGEEELARAVAVVEAHDRAEAAGSGVAVTADGRFVDVAVVRSARAVLARAQR